MVSGASCLRPRSPCQTFREHSIGTSCHIQCRVMTGRWSARRVECVNDIGIGNMALVLSVRQLDPRVHHQFAMRSPLGVKKTGASLDRQVLGFRAWIQGMWAHLLPI
jgi:hypothetical protein